MFSTISRAFDLLEKFGMLLAGACLAAIMLIVTCDASFRYLFNAPLSWSFDVISLYLLTATIFFALSSTFKTGGHITIDFLTQFMSPNVLRICTAICDLAMLPVLAFMQYTTAVEMFSAYVENRFNPGALPWPAWPSAALVVVGVGLLFVRVIIHAIQQLVDVHNNKPADVATPQEDLI